MVHLTEERIQELEHQVAAARKAQVSLSHSISIFQARDLQFTNLKVSSRAYLVSRLSGVSSL